MRIRRLDLTRYGKFTDRSIDFGPSPTEGPDLHIVYGLNEAGKSTMLNAFLDLLYGIEERSKYAFIHEYGSMRIGGTLELDGAEQKFIRVKQRSNSLWNEAAQPVGEMMLHAHLAGLSREAYGAMFSLDDETLEAGGKAILESRGDVGQLLFAAGAGLAHASSVIERIEAEADSVHRKHAQATDLALLKKQLIELKSQREAIDTLASTHEALEAERVDAARRYDRILSDRSALSIRLETVEKHRRTIPMFLDLSCLRARLEVLPTMATPKLNRITSVSDLIRDGATVETKVGENTGALIRLEEEISAIEIDEAVLGISERIRTLSERKARHVSAGLDLPARRMELQLMDEAVSSSLVALGQASAENPFELLLPEATVGIVRSMLEQRSGIGIATRVAREEAEKAARTLQAAQDRVGAHSPLPAPAKARLTAALNTCRQSGLERRLREAQEHVDLYSTRWNLAVARLHPWSGTAGELGKIMVPGIPQVNSWRASLGECQTRMAILAERAADLEESREAASSFLSGLRSAVNVPDDIEAATARRSRDAAWQTHRETLSPASADAFASALAVDDDIRGQRFDGAGDLQALRSATESLSAIDTVLTRVREQQTQDSGAFEDLVQAIKASASSIFDERGELASPEQRMQAIEHFLAARVTALEIWEELELARARLAGCVREGQALMAELLSAAEQANLASDRGETLPVVMSNVELFLQDQASLSAQLAEASKTVDAKHEELASRLRAVEIAVAREKAWAEGLREALSGTWLLHAIPLAALGGVLDRLSTLSKDLQDREALRRRSSKMEADRHIFSAEVAAVASLCRETVDPEVPEQAAARLSSRLEEADKCTKMQSELSAERDRLHEVHNALARELAIYEQAKAEVLTAFGVTTLEEVASQDELLKERDRHLLSIDKLEHQIIAEMATADIDTARFALEGIKIEALEAEASELRQRIEDIQQSLQQQVIRQTRASDKLEAIGSDSVIARLDARRRTILLEIEEKATVYLRLKLGAMASEAALQQYRERHRSGLMQRASDAFKMMSRGMYTGLWSQPSKGGEVLIARQADGRSKLADGLSKGTRFQLYLSLRMAGYLEFAKARTAVPFIGDDILESFDHLRSEEVFRLFGQMGQVGQVIYLTHHRHLCDIARQVVPGVRVHELS